MEALQYVLPYYIEPHRHYHNINHITKMLKGVYQYGDKDKVFRQVRVVDDMITEEIYRPLYHAILFHDITYDIPNKSVRSNEQLSAAEYTHYACEEDISQEEMHQVVDMIEATEFHFTDKLYDDYYTNLLLDLDLLSFTDPYHQFVMTQNEIDKEYLTSYPREYVIQRRKDFLLDIRDKIKYRVIDPSGALTNIAKSNISDILEEWDEIYD